MTSVRRPLILRFAFAVVALVMVAALVLAGCSPGGSDAETGLSAQRKILSEGYSMLYADATAIDRVELVLYLKAGTEEFSQVVTAVSAYGDELRRGLERLAADYPGVRIDLVPLPEMERRKRAAIGQGRLLQLVPFGGGDRAGYERGMLISLAGALNHESHLCRVMAAEEPDPELRKFLLAAEQRYSALYQRAAGLLAREHFRAASAS